MKILGWSFFLFCLSFAIHLIVWRLRRPKRQAETILMIFFVVLAGGFLALWSSNRALEAFVGGIPENVHEYLHIALVFTSLTFAYIITYSAIQADSPSLVMVIAIANAGDEGIAKADFERSMTDELLVLPRIQDLLTDKMVYRDGEKYRLTHKGKLFIRLFIFYRGLLKLPKGG